MFTIAFANLSFVLSMRMLRPPRRTPPDGDSVSATNSIYLPWKYMTLRPMDAANTVSILWFDPPEEDPWPVTDEDTSHEPTYRPFVGLGFANASKSPSLQGVPTDGGEGYTEAKLSCTVCLSCTIFFRCSDEPHKHCAFMPSC